MVLVKRPLHPKTGSCSPRLARSRVQRSILHRFQHHPHRSMCILRISQNISALLQKHTRHAIPNSDQQASLTTSLPSSVAKNLQQVPLKPQRHRRARIDDRLTCLRHIHLTDGLLVNPLELRRSTQRRNKPVRRVSRAQKYRKGRPDDYQTVATPYLREVRTTRVSSFLLRCRSER